MRRSIMMVLAATLLACGPDGPEPTHRGTYVGGEGAQELNIFVPCGDSTMLWVDGAAPTVERLRKAHQTMARSQFMPIYIEVRGRSMPRDDTGPGARLDALYNGILHIDTVLTQRPRVPMDCVGKLKPFDPNDIG